MVKVSLLVVSVMYFSIYTSYQPIAIYLGMLVGARILAFFGTPHTRRSTGTLALLS